MSRNDASQKGKSISVSLASVPMCAAAQMGGKVERTALPSLIRSRERNRMHARKTRQRKKEHMMNLQARADQLKDEQLQFKQIIDEKNTAGILLVMSGFASGMGDPALLAVSMSAQVEALVRRPISEIPDSSKISELPEIPPLFGAKKRKRNESDAAEQEVSQEDFEAFLRAGNFPDDGIDYALLGKDRSQCSTAELDKIRRERNRMHAKRTRDRKRLYMEEMEKVINQLEEENIALKNHVKQFAPGFVSSSSSSCNSRVSEQLFPQISTPESFTLDNREVDCLVGNVIDLSRVVSAPSSGNNSLRDKYEVSRDENMSAHSSYTTFNVTRYPRKHRRINESTSEQIVRMPVMA